MLLSLPVYSNTKQQGTAQELYGMVCTRWNAYYKREVLCAATQVTYIGGEWNYVSAMHGVHMCDCCTHQQPQMGTHLQKCGDDQCRNTPVTIGDEPLEIHVAGGHYSWVEVGNAREGLDGCIAEGGLGRAQEDLKHRHCRLDLSGSDVLHVDNGPCSLVHHHLQHSAGEEEGGGSGALNTVGQYVLLQTCVCT